MVHVVYIDVLFAINFIVNYLILFATAKLTGAVIRRLLLVLGAALGAVYGCVAFFQSMQFLSSLLFKVAVAVLMVLVSFGKRRLLRNCLIFSGISFAFGGCVFAIYWMTKGSNGLLNMRNGICYLQVPLGILLLSAGICFLVLNLVFKRCAAGGAKREFCTITMANNGRQAGLRALMDTGNHLTDPLTNRPVVIAEYESIRTLLPEAARSVLDTLPKKEFALAIETLPIDCKFKLVPYKTVGHEFDMLLAFRPEQISIGGKRADGALVAISPNPISDGGAYTALTGAAV